MKPDKPPVPNLDDIDYTTLSKEELNAIEFINSFPGEKIDKDILLKIPAYTIPDDIHCHLSFVDPKKNYENNRSQLPTQFLQSGI